MAITAEAKASLSSAQQAALARIGEKVFTFLRRGYTEEEALAAGVKESYTAAVTLRKLEEAGYVEPSAEYEGYAVTYEGLRAAGYAPGAIPAYIGAAKEAAEKEARKYAEAQAAQTEKWERLSAAFTGIRTTEFQYVTGSVEVHLAEAVRQTFGGPGMRASGASISEEALEAVAERILTLREQILGFGEEPAA